MSTASLKVVFDNFHKVVGRQKLLGSDITLSLAVGTHDNDSRHGFNTECVSRCRAFINIRSEEHTSELQSQR